MRKAETLTNATPRVTVKMTAKNADCAASIVALLEFFTKGSELPLPPTTITQDDMASSRATVYFPTCERDAFSNVNLH